MVLRLTFRPCMKDPNGQKESPDFINTLSKFQPDPTVHYWSTIIFPSQLNESTKMEPLQFSSLLPRLVLCVSLQILFLFVRVCVLIVCMFAWLCYFHGCQVALIATWPVKLACLHAFNFNFYFFFFVLCACVSLYIYIYI